MEKKSKMERGGEDKLDRITHSKGSRKDLEMLFEVNIEKERMSQIFCGSRKQTGLRKWRM